jgi:hypothetical protein
MGWDMLPKVNLPPPEMKKYTAKLKKNGMEMKTALSLPFEKRNRDGPS